MPDIEARLKRTDAQRIAAFIQTKRPVSSPLGMLSPSFKNIGSNGRPYQILSSDGAFPLQLDFELNFPATLRCPMCTWSVESTAAGSEKLLSKKSLKRLFAMGQQGLKSVGYVICQ
mgnify:CR=1 FL=1